MGANGDASMMAISSAHDPECVRHADDPVIHDMPVRVIQARGSSVPLFAVQVAYPRTADFTMPIAMRNLNAPNTCRM